MNLPVGISGPREHRRADKQAAYYSFQVSIPLTQGGSTTRQVYIGTLNTINAERFDNALAKVYSRVKTRARRQGCAVPAR
jgi:hypothetical protein